MKTLDKLRSNFFNKKSFNVGFNNRSPLSYISSTGPSVPSFSDPGIKSFSPSDWEGAYDTSDAVRAETQAEIAKGEGVAGAIYGGIKAGAGAATGGASDATFDGIEKAFGGDGESTTDEELAQYQALKAKFG